MDKIIKIQRIKDLKIYIKYSKNSKKIIYNYTKLFLESGVEQDFLTKKK
jgi:hypothetical protein